MTSISWDPAKYKEFETERIEPFFDLVALIQPFKNMKVVDLGCGTGALTAYLHHALNAKQTLGIDASKEMLAESQQFQRYNLHYELMKIEDFHPAEPYNLIFSNAALQWVPNHGKLIPQLTKYLGDQGQLAIQVPANDDYPTHTIAHEVASEYPFADYLNNRKSVVLDIEEYATMLYTLGYQKQVVRLQVYGHVLDSSESIIDWVKGSLLNYYKSHLSNELYNQFLKIYRKRLLDTIGWSSPFFFPMKRLLIWAQK